MASMALVVHLPGLEARYQHFQHGFEWSFLLLTWFIPLVCLFCIHTCFFSLGNLLSSVFILRFESTGSLVKPAGKRFLFHSFSSYCWRGFEQGIHWGPAAPLGLHPQQRPVVKLGISRAAMFITTNWENRVYMSNWTKDKIDIIKIWICVKRIITLFYIHCNIILLNSCEWKWRYMIAEQLPNDCKAFSWVYP